MISPLDKKLLSCIKEILYTKVSLVKTGKSGFDSQFMGLIGFAGFPTYPNTVVDELDYFEKQGWIKEIKSKREDYYVGGSTHYVLTYEGQHLLDD